EVTAPGLVSRRCELRAVRFEECRVTPPHLSPPHPMHAQEDRPGNEGVRDDRLVECRGLSKQRAGDNDPLARIAVSEVRIRVICEEGVEALRGIADVETRLATVAVDNLWPYRGRAKGLERPIVLRTPLQVHGVVGSDREALELQSREPLVQAVEVPRDLRQELLAERKIIAGERAGVSALR